MSVGMNNHQKKLLIVDEDRFVHEYIDRILGSDYVLSFAVNGVEAMEMLGNGTFDCILTDVLMNRMSGLELIEQLKQSKNTVPIVVVSSYFSAVPEKFFKGLASAFVVKPFTAQEIRQAVIHALSVSCGEFFLSKNRRKLSDKSSSSSLAVLLDVARMLNSTVELESLFYLVINLAAKTLNAQRASLMLIDQQEEELWSLVGVGIRKKEIRTPLTEGIAGEVVAKGSSLIINNPYSTSSFNRKIDQQTGFKTCNLLCSPIRKADGEIIGVIQVLNKIGGNFDDQDVRLLEAFAANAGIAIENAMLHEEQETQYLELQEAYRRLRQAQEQIIHQEKLASIGQVSAGIAHEVKNQLFGFTLLEIIREHYSDNEELKKYTDMVIAARDRIVTLIDGIRDYSKKKEFARERISLARLLREIVDFIKLDRTLRNKRITCTLPDDQLLVSGNDDKLKQVFINLLRNAIQATDDQGHIDIVATRKDSQLRVEISDNGCGVPEEIKDQIFKPFFTTKGDEGTGLGLDICKEIIIAHDGTIEFDSLPGQGSSFSVNLPVFK